MKKLMAAALLAVLPLAAAAQDAPPAEAPASVPIAEQAAQPAATAPKGAEPSSAQEPRSARAVELESELVGQVGKARSLVNQLDRALKAARTDTERARLREELAKARSTVGALEKQVADTSTKLEQAEGAAAKERVSKDALASEKDRVAREKARLAEENQLLGKNIQYTALVAGILIALGALVATFFLLRARNRAKKLARDLQKRSQAEDARNNAEDWLLAGEQGRLKLRGVLLATEGRGSIVGRGEAEADVIIEDKEESVSRRHARFFLRDGVLYVEDLRSLNGTFVNGKRINAGRVQIVKEQDEMRFGKLSFTLRRA